MQGKYIVLGALIIGACLGALNLAWAAIPPSVSTTTDLGIYELIPSEDGVSYLVSEKCADRDLDRYEAMDRCLENCGDCILDDELCWSCASPPVSEPKLNWWQKLKNWVIGLFKLQQTPPSPSAGDPSSGAKTEEPGFFKRFFNRIVGLFKSSDDRPVVQLREEPSGQEQEFEKLKNVGTSILKYHKGEAAGEESRIDRELKDAIAAAPDMAALLKLQSLALVYCADKHPDDFGAEQTCRKEFMKAFKKRGDELKEQLFAAIDPNDTSGKTYQQIEQLRSLLMAGTSASGEGEWFSTENIKKVMQGLNVKMREWFKNALNNAEFVELAQWHSLALAYTGSGGNGIGLFEGADPLVYVQYRARRLALQEMIKIDICNPDPAKLKKFQDLLANPGCEKRLGNAKACAAIANGDLESAYALLYGQDDGDEANSHPRNSAPEPVECKKKPITETDAPASPATAITTEAEESANQPQKPPVTAHQTPSGESADAERSLPDQPPQQPAESSTTSGTAITSDPPVEVPPAEPPSPQTTTSSPPQVPEPVTDESEPPSAEPLPPQQTEPPPPPPDPCLVHIFPDLVIGWNFSLNNCNGTYSQAFGYFLPCGSPPPLVIAEQLETEALCYETAGGFIDYNTTIPCHPRPLPPPHVADCVAMRLEQLFAVLGNF